MEVRGDSLVLNVDDKGALTIARTTGKPARFQQKVDPNKGLVKGEANEVVFDNRDSSVTLIGNAVLRQDNASFSGPRIVYSTTRKQIEASGNDTERVQLIFPPSIRESSGKTP
jgi:lipopolysaccharide export system protein LptA